MAEIVLGIATSHGPMLSTPPEQWDLRVPADHAATLHFKGRTWSYQELAQARRAENLVSQLGVETWRARHAACQRALATLADTFAAARIDVAVVVGNDQMEIYDSTLIPAFSVGWGERIVNSMYSAERLAKLPVGIAVSVPGHVPPEGAVYPGAPALGRHILQSVMADEFDVAAIKDMPKGETPHALGFVYRQIMRDAPPPSVPIVLNTFYPPNQPGVARCYAFGRAIARAIASWPGEARVAVLASGGLTHFVIDEALDRVVLDAITRRDMTEVSAIDPALFESGASEIKNWIATAGVLDETLLSAELLDYVPCYRSEAGTGNAMGFMLWR